MSKLNCTIFVVIALIVTSTYGLEGEPATRKRTENYDHMAKKDLQRALMQLQTEVLITERRRRQAYERSKEATRIYQSATDEEKPAALLRMLEAMAAAKKKDEDKALAAEFRAAKDAYINMLVAEEEHEPVAIPEN